jgi:hypothetical protein
LQGAVVAHAPIKASIEKYGKFNCGLAAGPKDVLLAGDVRLRQFQYFTQLHYPFNRFTAYVGDNLITTGSLVIRVETAAAVFKTDGLWTLCCQLN